MFICDIEKVSCTKAYKVWRAMISRCYSVITQAKQPTYEKCSVSAEWDCFSNFLAFYEANHFEGAEIDKDILGDGTLYSPSTCLFVTKKLNLAWRGAQQRSNDVGVTWHRRQKKWQVTLCIDGKNRHLGYYDTTEEAKDVYKNEKIKLLKECIEVERKFNKMLTDEVIEKININLGKRFV